MNKYKIKYMKNYAPYLAVVLFATLSVVFTIDYENEIETLESEVSSLEFAFNFQKEQCYLSIVDMQNTIDSLEAELVFYEPKTIGQTIDEILSAIISVESSGNDSAYHKGEDAVGCLQIRQVMVNDVNRILQRQGSLKRYTYMDRWNRNKSIEMFDIFCKYYGLNKAEDIARGWNGGPRGMNNPATLGYWDKVQNELNS